MELILTGFSLVLFLSQADSQINNGDIRLAGRNSNSTQGRIEVYYNGSWGTVCDDGFTNKEAIVVCRQIGSTNPSAASVALTSVFGPGTGDIMMDDVNCQATETRLQFCRFAGWRVSNCGHDEDVGVICPVVTATPSPTLTPAPTQAPIVPGPGNCSTPDPNIRLVGPSNLPGIGVVQLRQNNMWGGVCDDDWDIRDARVVCRMLCYDPAKALPGSLAFDTSNITEPMTVNYVNCNGNEARITDCPRSAWANNTCTRDEQARVTCVDMDNSPPMRPQPLLDCTNGMLTASFSRKRDPYLEQKHLSVALNYTGPCNPVLNTDIDYVSIGVPFDECGTQLTYNSTHMIYNTVIRYLPTYTSGDISNANTYMVHVTCELPRNPNADKPIQPLTETVTQKAPGEFIVTLHFFRNNSFVSAVTQFPLQIPLGEWLSAALQLQDVDQNLRLVVPTCYATPSANRNDTVRYPLFTNKCIDDQTVGFFPLNDTWFGYRYQTFKFVQYSEVYIHCNAYICEKNDPAPQCDRSCFTSNTTTSAGKRRKRDVPPRLVYVSSPSIIVYDQHHPNDIVRPATQSSTTAPQSTTVRMATTTKENIVTRATSPKVATSPSHVTSGQSDVGSNVVTLSTNHVTSDKSENHPTADSIVFVESGSCSISVPFTLFFLISVIFWSV